MTALSLLKGHCLVHFFLITRCLRPGTMRQMNEVCNPIKFDCTLNGYQSISFMAEIVNLYGNCVYCDTDNFPSQERTYSCRYVVLGLQEMRVHYWSRDRREEGSTTIWCDILAHFGSMHDIWHGKLYQDSAKVQSTGGAGSKRLEDRNGKKL